MAKLPDDLRKRAEAQFAVKPTPLLGAERAKADYDSVADTLRERSARLKAERLAREAAEKKPEGSATSRAQHGRSEGKDA
jgi:hypothetical protein